MAAATAAAKTVDKANFKSIVSICPVDTSEAPAIHLVAVTGSGVRLYFTTTGLSSPATTRPYQLLLAHVRLPPGYSANALTHRPTKVHKALYTHGCGVLCASESAESDVVWSVSCDQFPYHAALAESQAVVAVDGVIWAIADVTPPTMWGSRGEGRNPAGLRPPLVVTQQHQEPRELVVLSAAGAHILTSLRPVDQLQYLLQEGAGADGVAVKEFFAAMSPTQACATALILATDPNMQNAQIAEWATQCLFRYGAAPPAPTSQTIQGQPNPQMTQIQSPGGYSFHPTQISTPLVNPYQQHPHHHQHQTPVTLNGTSFNASMAGNVSHAVTTTSNGTIDAPFSPLHNALYLYLARILRPVWAVQLLKEQVVEGNKVLTSALSSTECSFLARQVELLSRFMNTSPSTAASTYQIGLTIGINTATPSSSSGEEASSVAALCQLLQHTLQLLRLWTLLTHHNLPSVVAALQKPMQEQLRGMSLRDLVLAGRDICRSLIMNLLDKYHGDNASVTAISSQLREVCPQLYRTEDAQLSKASQLILEAKASADPARREAGFREAVTLCKGVGGCVNVAGVGAQLASGGCYSGLVDLALSVAGQRDKEGRALPYYKAGQPHYDAVGYQAFTSRMECYRVLLDHLTQLVGSTTPCPTSPSVPPRPGPPPTAPAVSAKSSDDASHYADQIMTLISSSEDELCQVTMFQWLLDTGRTEQLLCLPCPTLEGFLKSPAPLQPNKEPLHHLLWRYYERNKDYHLAARTLALLADQPGNTTLSTRVEHLSRALMCLSSCEMNTASTFTEFLLHLEEKKDVARVQLMVLDGVSNAGGTPEAIATLNSALLDITRLYEDFAEPYQLWECKLAILACAGHSEPQLVQSLWSHIIEVELARNEESPLPLRIDAVAAKLKTLARQYTNNPQYFPIEHIIRVCELKSVRMGVTNHGWLATALLSCGLSITKLIQTYHSLYRSGESIWETERQPYHLLRVLCHLITTLIDSPPPALQLSDRRVLREHCLDRVASYLTDLDASAEPTAGLIAAHLRTCQLHLERTAAY